MIVTNEYNIFRIWIHIEDVQAVTKINIVVYDILWWSVGEPLAGQSPLLEEQNYSPYGMFHWDEVYIMGY